MVGIVADGRGDERPSVDDQSYGVNPSASSVLQSESRRSASCGATYTLETSGKGHRYYNCRTFTRTGKEACAGYRIPQSKLDASCRCPHDAEP